MSIKHIIMLADFQHGANAETFRTIFGKELGDHLWSKFDDNLLTLCNQMSNDNLLLLIEHIEQQISTGEQNMFFKRYNNQPVEVSDDFMSTLQELAEQGKRRTIANDIRMYNPEIDIDESKEIANQICREFCLSWH